MKPMQTAQEEFNHNFLLPGERSGFGLESARQRKFWVVVKGYQ